MLQTQDSPFSEDWVPPPPRRVLPEGLAGHFPGPALIEWLTTVDRETLNGHEPVEVVSSRLGLA